MKKYWQNWKTKWKQIFTYKHFKFVLEREFNRDNALKFTLYLIVLLISNLVLILHNGLLWYDALSVFSAVSLALFFLNRIHSIVLGQNVSVALYNAKVNIKEQLRFVPRANRSKSISLSTYIKMQAKRNYTFLYFLSFCSFLLLIITIPFLVINYT